MKRVSLPAPARFATHCTGGSAAAAHGGSGWGGERKGWGKVVGGLQMQGGCVQKRRPPRCLQAVPVANAPGAKTRRHTRGLRTAARRQGGLARGRTGGRPVGLLVLWPCKGGARPGMTLQGGRITSQPGRMNAMRDVTTTQQVQKREGPKGGRAMRWGRDLGQQNRRWADWNVERHTH